MVLDLRLGLTYILAEAIEAIGVELLYLIFPLLPSVTPLGDVTLLYMGGIFGAGLRRRRITQAIRPRIATKTTPPMTPPAIGPAFDLLLLTAEVEVALAEVVVA